MIPKKITLHGFIVWGICAFFFMYEFLLRTVLGTFQLPIMQDLQLSPFKFALLSSTAYQVIYGFMQLPVGIIAKRYGLKKTLLFAVVSCGVANLGFALTQDYSLAIFFSNLDGLWFILWFCLFIGCCI